MALRESLSFLEGVRRIDLGSHVLPVLSDPLRVALSDHSRDPEQYSYIESNQLVPDWVSLALECPSWSGTSQ